MNIIKILDGSTWTNILQDPGSIVQEVDGIPAFDKVKSSSSANGLLPKQPHGDGERKNIYIFNQVVKIGCRRQSNY